MLLGEMRKGLLSHLNPSLHLIGSVAEGSRLWKASEVDFTLKFDLPEEEAMWVDSSNACRILMKGGGGAFSAFSRTDGIDETPIFSYEKFLHVLLKEIRRCMSSVSSSPEWPPGLWFQKHWRPCSNCREASRPRTNHTPYTHCLTCRPPVTHTKLGPCLVYQWEGEERPELLLVDFIPAFPIRSAGLLPLFDNAVSTLFTIQPTNWQRHFRGFLDRDRLLPEDFDKNLRREEGIFNVGVKLLNYEEGFSNAIIRPGQVTNIKVHGKLKEIYTRLKAVKDLLKISGAQSYVIKKTILMDEMREALNDPQMDMDEAMLLVLSHPELKRNFSKKIDFEQWSRLVEKRKNDGHDTYIDVVPLLKRLYKGK